MAAAADKRGLKRICTNCGARFYDLNAKPIKCPACDTEFTGEIKLKSRRGRAAANDTGIVEAEGQVSEKTAAQEDNDSEDDDSDLPEDDAVVSLDDLDDDDHDDDLDDSDELGDLDDELGDLDAELDEDDVDIEEDEEKTKE